MSSTIECLLRRSHLFDDPSAYEAGVLEAIEALVGVGEAADPERESVSRPA